MSKKTDVNEEEATFEVIAKSLNKLKKVVGDRYRGYYQYKMVDVVFGGLLLGEPVLLIGSHGNMKTSLANFIGSLFDVPTVKVKTQVKSRDEMELFFENLEKKLSIPADDLMKNLVDGINVQYEQIERQLKIEVEINLIKHPAAKGLGSVIRRQLHVFARQVTDKIDPEDVLGYGIDHPVVLGIKPPHAIKLGKIAGADYVILDEIFAAPLLLSKLHHALNEKIVDTNVGPVSTKPLVWVLATNPLNKFYATNFAIVNAATLDRYALSARSLPPSAQEIIAMKAKWKTKMPTATVPAELIYAARELMDGVVIPDELMIFCISLIAHLSKCYFATSTGSRSETAKDPFETEKDCSLCVAPGTMVMVGPDLHEKPIEEISVGEFVLTHKGRFKRVSAVFKRPYHGYLTEMRTWMHTTPLRTTPEHPIHINAENTKQTEWVPAWTLRKGDGVTSPVYSGIEDRATINLETELSTFGYHNRKGFLLKTLKNGAFAKYKQNCPKTQIKINKAFMRFVGYFLSEGNAHLNGRQGRSSLSFGKNETKSIHEAVALFKTVFSIPATVCSPRGSNSVQVVANCKPLAIYLMNTFGGLSEQKTIPEWILKLPPVKQSSLLATAIIGDGWKFFARFGYGSASNALAESLRMIMLRCGLVPSIRLKKTDKASKIDNRKVQYKHPFWELAVGGRKQLLHMEQLTDLHHPYLDCISKTATALPYTLTSNELHTRIRKWNTVAYAGDVHNLEVEDDNSYIANHIAVHNCIFKSMPCGLANLGKTRPIIRLEDAMKAHALLEVRKEANEDDLSFALLSVLPHRLSWNSQEFLATQGDIFTATKALVEKYADLFVQNYEKIKEVEELITKKDPDLAIELKRKYADAPIVRALLDELVDMLKESALKKGDLKTLDSLEPKIKLSRALDKLRNKEQP